jgi:hypothetical protein
VNYTEEELDWLWGLATALDCDDNRDGRTDVDKWFRTDCAAELVEAMRLGCNRGLSFDFASELVESGWTALWNEAGLD